MNVLYRKKHSKSLRYLFTLQDKNFGITGSIFEREDPKPQQDRYFTSFAGKFSWEIGDGFVPFSFYHEGKDVSHEIFYGVPQGLLKMLYDYDPILSQKYATGDFRNCGNCSYAKFEQAIYDDYAEGTHRQSDRMPRHFFTCRQSSEGIDFGSSHFEHERYAGLIQRRKASLRENSCSTHSRSAFQQDGMWVQAEYRRLGCLNPRAIQIKKNQLILADTLRFGLQEQI